MRTIATSPPWFVRLAPAVAVTVLLTAPARTHAQSLPTLLVMPASGRGVSTQIIERARGMLVLSLSRPDRMRVVDFYRPATSMPPPPGIAVAIARQSGARVAAAFDVSRDAGRTTFEIWCWDAITGGPACHIREDTAAAPEILPEFMEWVARRVMQDLGGARAIAATGTGDGGALAGQAPAPRTPHAYSLGARAELLVPLESPAKETFALSGFALLFTVDAGHLLTDLTLEYATGGNGRHLTGAALDLFAPLGSGESFPYVGTGIGWFDQRLGGRGASGLQVRPTLGMLWGRNDLVRVRVEVSFFMNLFEEQELDRLIPGSGAGHVARGFILATGATF